VEELRKAFSIYLDECAELKYPHNETQDNLQVILNKKFYLRRGFQLVEERSQFRNLVVKTMGQFSRKKIEGRESHWKQKIQNILRKSRIYLDFFEKIATKEQLFSRYVAALSSPKVSVTTIAPIEFASFSGNSLSFDSFELKKFSWEELAHLTQNDILEIFYPSSSFDMDLLQNYWWIVISDEEDAPELDNDLCFLNLRPEIFSGEVYRKRPTFSKIEKALQILTLFDWQYYSEKTDVSQYEDKDPHKTWTGFGVPFTIILDDFPARPPNISPDLTRLAIEPKFDHRGEEIGEGPVRYIHMDEDETARFQKTIAKYDRQLTSILLINKWSFIEIALGYLVKAFFAEGLDQLLWHIIVIEALLGKDTEGLTEILANRSAKILGNSQDEEKRIHDTFKRLYNFRSRLVHGSEFDKSVFEGSLSAARNVSRAVTSWFVNYLYFVSSNLNASTIGFPTRSELISVIDMTKIKESNRVNALIQCLPSTFPNGAWDIS
jgi:hypothetical protein